MIRTLMPSRPKRCPDCKGRINTFSLRCHLCDKPWVSKRENLDRYVPEPVVPDEQLFVDRNYEDVPL